MATASEKGLCSKAYITLHVPNGKTGPMRKLLKPVLKQADPTLSLVQIHETESPVVKLNSRMSGSVPDYCAGSGNLSVAAISIITFLPEEASLVRTQRLLQEFPWKFHHRFELSPSTSPSFVSAKQEFYSLSRQYPLLAVSPCPHARGCVVRFNITVRRYRPMMEFYRLLTDSEMESTKPDFAVFTVNTSDPQFARALSSDPFFSSSSKSSSSYSKRESSSTSSRLSCSVQLALKHCPNLEPYPLTSAYLTVLVRNMPALRSVLLPGQVVETSPNSYLITDPDGNVVAVRDIQPPCPPATNKPHQHLHPNPACRLAHAQTCISAHGSSCSSSYCESQDSGRFSDSDRGCRELDRHVQAVLREFGCLDITDFSEPSDTDAEELALDDSGACLAGGRGSDSDVSQARVRIGQLSAIHTKCQYV